MALFLSAVEARGEKLEQLLFLIER